MYFLEEKMKVKPCSLFGVCGSADVPSPHPRVPTTLPSPAPLDNLETSEWRLVFAYFVLSLNFLTASSFLQISQGTYLKLQVSEPLSGGSGPVELASRVGLEQVHTPTSAPFMSCMTLG